FQREMLLREWIICRPNTLDSVCSELPVIVPKMAECEDIPVVMIVKYPHRLNNSLGGSLRLKGPVKKPRLLLLCNTFKEDCECIRCVFIKKRRFRLHHHTRLNIRDPILIGTPQHRLKLERR